MLKDQDQLEFALTQYLDGTLSEFDKRVLEERLAGDAEARLLLEEYRHLDAMLRGSRELPALDYDALAKSISVAVEEEESHVAAPVRMQTAWVRRFAIAAGVMLAAVVGWHLVPQGAAPVGAPEPGELIVKGPSIEAAPDAPPMTIAVGPSKVLAERGLTMGLVDEAIAAPSPRVVISAADQPVFSDERLY